MKKTKQDEGITLIALIITIIVLLILAAVTIGEIKESKIIKHAQNAVTSYDNAQTNETEKLKDFEDMIDNYVSAKVEYYQYETMIQKIDYKNNTCTTYQYDDGAYKSIADTKFTKGETTTVAKSITVYSNGFSSTASATINVGATQFYINYNEEDIVGSYLDGDILYARSLGNEQEIYLKCTLLTDSKIISKLG